MTQQTGKGGNPNVLAAAMIFGAILTAGVGTMVPGLAELTGPEASWIPWLFYAAAAIEVILALWLRARLLKVQGPARPSGGTIQRQ